jgi:hypothetical protein
LPIFAIAHTAVRSAAHCASVRQHALSKNILRVCTSYFLYNVLVLWEKSLEMRN